jgi:hypothetical protein
LLLVGDAQSLGPVRTPAVECAVGGNHMAESSVGGVGTIEVHW